MTTSCIEWNKCRDRDGYGIAAYPGRRNRVIRAHRLAWMQAHGPIPAGLTVDHLCFNPSCINVDHLRLLTNVANATNQRSAFKTVCVHGHPYTPANTYYLKPGSGSGRRRCRTCNANAVRACKARKVARANLTQRAL